MSLQLFKNGLCCGPFNANHQLAFVCKVERVQPQQFAKPTNGGLNGQAALGEFNPASAACRKLMDHGVDTASRGIPQGLHAGNTAQRLNQRGEYRAVAAQFAVQPQTFAQVQDGRPVAAQRAGLALLGTISGSLYQALNHEAERDAAIVTFLMTASGVTILGIGSAFWGLVLGGVCFALFSRARRA